jgi:O-methyltransferase
MLSAVKRLVVDTYQRQHLSGVARRVAEARLTYLSPAKLRNLEACLRRIEADGIPGDCLEFGVALGGSAIVAATQMGAERSFAGYDVFGLIPPPSGRDDDRAHARYAVIASGRSDGIGGDRYYGYESDLLAKVRNNFAAFGLEVDGRRICLVRGFFAETLPLGGGAVAFAHIDCDWYDPVMLCLEHSYRRLSRGGFIILDDYNDYGGCRRATEEFMARHADLRAVDVAHNAVLTKA